MLRATCTYVSKEDNGISNQKDIYKDKDKWPSLEIIEQVLKK